jgi:hypothetical protein
VFVFVAVWIVPRTRAALMLVIRDDIVEATRLMASLTARVALMRKVPSKRESGKVAFLLRKLCALRINSLATMRNNS